MVKDTTDPKVELPNTNPERMAAMEAHAIRIQRELKELEEDAVRSRLKAREQAERDRQRRHRIEVAKVRVIREARRKARLQRMEAKRKKRANRNLLVA